MRRDFCLRAVEPVKFVQLSAEAFAYRDGIEFGNGSRVGLQSFREGVAFEVLGLGQDGTVDREGQVVEVLRAEERRQTSWPVEHR
jgi:hypothetical protein